jgi:hypothetical protein
MNKLIEEVERLILRSHFLGTSHSTELNNLKTRLESAKLDFNDVLTSVLKKLDKFELLFESSKVDEIPFTEKLIDSSRIYYYGLGTTASGDQILSFEGELRPFKIIGDSMVDFGIAEGDVLLVESGEFTDGDVAVVRIYDKLFVKKINRCKGYYELISGNSNYPTAKIPDGTDFEILGRVVYLLRQM